MNKNQPSGVDTDTPMITREEYLNARRQAMIDAAYLNSLHRELPAIPMIANPESKEDFEEIRQRDIAIAQEYIEKDPNNPKYRSWLESAKNRRYDQLVPGSSCVYTFTDNYGKKYRCPSNYKFARTSDEDRGFVQIPLSEVKPGDGIMDRQHHMMMFDSFTKDGTPLFNYSSGGDTENSIKIKRKYHPGVPFTSNTYSAYRFVGDQEDNAQWNAEYNQYYRDYINALNATVKKLPPIPVPKLEAPVRKLIQIKK